MKSLAASLKVISAKAAEAEVTKPKIVDNFILFFFLN